MKISKNLFRFMVFALLAAITFSCSDQMTVEQLNTNHDENQTDQNTSILLRNNGDPEEIQVIMDAIQLGLIDLAQEDKFKSIVAEMALEVGEELHYTFSHESLVEKYNSDGDNLLEKVFESALNNSNGNEELAYLAMESFTSFVSGDEVLYPLFTNIYVHEELPTSEEYAEWDGLSPSYIAFAELENPVIYGYEFVEDGVVNNFESELLEYFPKPGWHISLDTDPDPPVEERWICYFYYCGVGWSQSGCEMWNDGRLCRFSFYKLEAIIGECLSGIY